MNKSICYLYGHLIFNEETFVNYLKERILLPELGSYFKLKMVLFSEEYQKNNRKKNSNGDLITTSYLR